MDSVIILNNITKIDKELLKNKSIIGVDRGAYNAFVNNIKLDIAIGDFDSVSNEMLDKIKKNSKKTIFLNPIKDKTDTGQAIDLCKESKSIYILGGITGKRIEHFIANIIELINDERIIMIDDNSLIETKRTSFIPRNDYKYVSFFSLTNESLINLKGFKYNLDNYTLSYNNTLCISNEKTNNSKVELLNGRLLVIYSKDDKNENI
ncbi:MAG: thiamine diphosphokinase [Anaeroplasma sp.]